MSAFEKLSDIADLNPPAPTPDGGPVSFLPMSGVMAESASTLAGEDRSYADVCRGYTPFLKGDLLVAKITPCFENGKIAQATVRRRIGFGSSEFHVVRPKAGIDPRYLLQFLRQERIRQEGERKMTGSAGQRRVPEHFLSGLRVRVPSLPEQLRIAGLLDRADALRANRRSALSQLKEAEAAVFNQMFVNHPNTWSVSSIADLAAPVNGAIRTGPFGSQLLHSEFTDSGIAVLGIDNAVANAFQWAERRYISAPKYEQLKRYTVRPGDILITIMGTCGRCAVVPDDIPLSINTKHLCCITLDRTKCLPEFIHGYFLMHPTARAYLGRTAKGAIMAGLNMGIIRSMPVTVPPMALQQDYVARMVAIRRLSARCQNALALHDELFASLQHRAFRGEL